MPSEKSSLSIRLTEPAVTLRTTPDRASRQYEDNVLPPAVVRGLLTLDLAKPTKVSSIKLKLRARAITHYIQGSGPTRNNVTEQYKVHSASTVVFKAGPRHRATSTKPKVQCPDDQAESSAHDHPLNQFGNKRSVSLDPRSTGSRVNQPSSSDGLGTVIDRNPRLDRISAPPYPGPADRHSFLKPDSPEGRSLSVASSSRISESQSSYILSQTSLNPDDHYDSSSSSIRSMRGARISRASSIQEIPEDDSESCNTSAIRPDVGYYGLSRIATGSSSRSSDHSHRGRSHSRFSFGKVVHVFEAVKDRVRSRSPRAESRRRSYEQEERGRSLIKGKGKAQVNTCGVRDAPPQIGGIEPSLDDGMDETGDGWVLFPEGTHTYPIFFTIPNDSPPTAKADRGSLTWKLKAEVRRPGAFKSNIAVEKEVVVVSMPRGDDTEQVEGLDLERDWDGQFQYRVQATGRDIPVGGKVPFQLTITPLTRFKMHSIMVHLDERTEYYAQAGSRVQSDAIRRATLLVVEPNNQNQRYSEPILPLASDEPHVFRKSPLYRFLRPGEDESEVASSFAGLGPWTIRHELAVPDSCSILRPSNRNKRSNIIVDHTLKIILRVEKEEGAVKKKLYDIVIQAPIRILSCHCTSEWTSLPRYDEVPRSGDDSSEDASTCPCTRRRANARRDSHSADNFPVPQDRLAPFLRGRSNPSGSPTSRTQLHERLMRGLVSESGEAPPSYEHVGASVNA